MARLPGHRQTKGAATDKPKPTATAPHLDFTGERYRFMHDLLRDHFAAMERPARLES